MTNLGDPNLAGDRPSGSKPPQDADSRPAQPSTGRGPTPQELRARLTFDDQRLLAECEVHLHRTGGPGGQHRDKVASAVRLRHRPSGFVVTATERRSQRENRLSALRRLREAIAIGVRCDPPDQITWPGGVDVRERRLQVNVKNPAFWQVLALTLDVLAAEGGNFARAAARLGLTTSSLTRFLADHSKAWEEVLRIRKRPVRTPGAD